VVEFTRHIIKQSKLCHYISNKIMILDKIVENKKKEIGENREFYKVLADRIKNVQQPHNFLSAISSLGKTNLIAEIKKFSPGNPEPVRQFDAMEIARVYESSGASAISVLTDRDYFGGGFEILASVRNRTEIPVLCKDFIIDELQIYVARYYGADAVLLIARVLDDRELSKFINLADSLGMSSLVEVHSREESERVLSAGVKIIGINNRDLDTLEVNLNTTLEIMQWIPKNRVIVSESGIKTREDILKLKKAGVSAVLIGETLLRSPDISAKIKELIASS